jgi:hypothetical protein
METTPMKDEIKFKQYMTTLGELFDRPMTSLLTTLYWKVMEPFTDEECERAFKEILFSAKFFPKPAEFIEVLRGNESDLVAQAWIKTVEAIRHYGNYASIKFDDPVIHAVIEFMGGWPETGNWTDDELKWKQREFERLYGIMQARGKHPEYLPGLIETTNRAKGYDKQEEIIMIRNFETERKRLAK